MIAPSPRLPNPALLALCGALMAAGAALGQAPPADGAAAPPTAQSEAHAKEVDRIMGLVRAKKCGAAKVAAEKAGEVSLAEQIGQVCGVSPNNGAPRGGGGPGGGRGRPSRGG